LFADDLAAVSIVKNGAAGKFGLSEERLKPLGIPVRMLHEHGSLRSLVLAILREL
jgi:hypothetical protein